MLPPPWPAGVPDGLSHREPGRAALLDELCTQAGEEWWQEVFLLHSGLPAMRCSLRSSAGCSARTPCSTSRPAPRLPGGGAAGSRDTLSARSVPASTSTDLQ